MFNKFRFFLLVWCIGLLVTFCSYGPKRTFEKDLKILSNVPDLTILKRGPMMVAVSGMLQGRVFTSTANGMKGNSYGWFDQKLMNSGDFQHKISSLGGESRLWSGPEAGKFALFFKPGAEQISQNIVRPPALDTTRFTVVDKSDTQLVCQGSMELINYQNTRFKVGIERIIKILSREQMEENLKIKLDPQLSAVAFRVSTRISNQGSKTWSKENGLIAIWELGCFPPEKKGLVFIPTRGIPDSVRVYFTPVNEQRLQIKDSLVVYRADGNYLNKIGIAPDFTKPILASYHPELNVLTIIQFKFTNDSLYVNSHWKDQKYPYKGDVINVFNDGPTENSGPFGPFYELETSSSARELKVGQSMEHWSITYHFQGSAEELNDLAIAVFGTSLQEIQSILN